MQKLEEFKDWFVVDHKPSQEHDVKVVDILKINMYLLCKNLGY